jgi:hypothetical protein
METQLDVECCNDVFKITLICCFAMFLWFLFWLNFGI